MRTREDAGRRYVLIGLLFFVGVCIAPARAETLTESKTFRFAAEPGTSLGLKNLVGFVRLEPTSGSDIEIEANIFARDDDPKRARALISGIEVVARERGQRRIIVAEYPVDDFRRYFVDGRGSRGKTELRYQRTKVRLVTERGKDVAEAGVDFVVRVPRGVPVAIANAGGAIEGAGLDGDLDLELAFGGVTVRDSAGSLRAETSSGSVTVANHTGRVMADTGSGAVTLSSITGDVAADTGSGEVRLRNIVGRIVADTGSGRVRIEDCSGERVRADTGSGSVRIDRCQASLDIDTGSGSVEISDLRADEELLVDTGSGSVRVAGDLSPVRRLEIDTGSGNVELRTSAPPSLRLEAENNGAKILIDLPDMREVRKGKGFFEAHIGDAAGDGEIDTSSGRIVFVMQ